MITLLVEKKEMQTKASSTMAKSIFILLQQRNNFLILHDGCSNSLFIGYD